MRMKLFQLNPKNIQFLLLIASFLSLINLPNRLNAQIQKGTWLVGGNLGTGSNNLDGGSGFFTFSPNVGYFITDQLALTGGIGYSSASFIDDTFSGQIGARYYLGKVSDVWPYARAGAAFNDSSSQYSVGLGANIFITENVAIESNLLFNRIISDQLLSNISQFGLSIGFQVFLFKKAP